MERNHGSLYHHLETTKKSAVICCKQDYNEGYCKDGETHGINDDTNVEMVCSPPSYAASPSGKWANVLTGNRNY